MKLRTIASSIGMLSVFSLAACGGGESDAPEGEPSAWTQGLSRKIQPTTEPGKEESVSVATYRKAWASWQLVVRGKGGMLRQVTVAMDGDLSDGNGHTLAKSNVTFFREAFINLAGIGFANKGNMPVPQSSPTGDTNVPDPLIPLVDPYTGQNAGQPFDVPADRNQPVLIDVFVPEGTTAGTYTGTIKVSASGATADVPLSVTVWDIDVPDMLSVKTHFKMSINSLYKYHGGVAQCQGGNCYLDVTKDSLALVKRYEDLAHEHRIDTGQQLIPVPNNGCEIPSQSDWDSYDTYMTPYMEGYHFNDGVPSTRFNVPFNPGQNYGIDGTCGPVAPHPDQAKFSALAKAWADHLKSKGWFEKAIAYAYDEPVPSAYMGIAQGSDWLQKGDPDWKAHVMDTLAPNDENATLFGPAIGIYTVSLPLYGKWSGVYKNYGPDEWPGLFAQGTELWFYTANAVLPPYPTISTDTLDGYEPLIQLWGAWNEKATGFLYWDVTAWEENNPWGPNNTWSLPGDGVLIYPGNHDGNSSPIGSPSDVAIDGPIPSYRLKTLRQGLQDWALFRLAEEMGLRDVVEQQVATVYSQLGGCNSCPFPPSGFYWQTEEDAIVAARAAVAEAMTK